MKSSFLWILSLCATLINITIAAPSIPPPPPTGLGSFSYYVLAVQNPFNYCLNKTTQCHPPPTTRKFTIHGLWPQHASVHSNEQFDPSLPMQKTLVNDLQDKWVNANDVKNANSWIGFLKHEWDRHGTYSGLSQIQYYQEALMQYNTVMTVLPNIATGNRINITTLRDRLYARNLGKPAIVCGEDTKAPNRKLIVEYRFKIDRQSKAFVTNPRAYNCNPNVVLYES